MTSPSSPTRQVPSASEHSCATVPETVSSVSEFVQLCPAIDNHAHNIYAQPEADFHLNAVTSEAQGKALIHGTSTLAHVRAVKMLSKWLNCEPTNDAICAKRKEMNYQEWVKMCITIARLDVILMDTGLTSATPVLPLYEHHATAYEIFRLEKDAEEILRDIFELPRHAHHVQPADVSEFQRQISRRGETYTSTHSVALKSVIGYRTGLAVVPDGRYLPDIYWLEEVRKSSHCRIQHKLFGDWLVTRACEVAGRLKPIQFHTGFGDSDIRLELANPCLLKDLVTHFPQVRFVLLHTGYPHVREAAYMTSTYANVYLDLSLIAPCLSGKGIKRVLEEVLELAPISKLLFGTDGHLWPETFALSSVQFREALGEIFEEEIAKGHLSTHEALLATRNIMFDNANRLYGLNLRTPAIPQIEDVKSPLHPPALQIPPLSPTLSPPLARTFSPISIAPSVQQVLQEPLSVSPTGLAPPIRAPSSDYKYVRVIWVDIAGLHRCRIVPASKFNASTGIRLAFAVLFLGAEDNMHEDAPISNEFVYLPDLNTLHSLPYLPGTNSVMGWFREKDPSKRRHTEASCPRSTLRHAEMFANEAFDATFLIGFELEFTLLESIEPLQFVKKGPFAATSSVRAGSKALAAVEEMVDVMEQMGLDAQLWHAESAPGQYEIPLGPHSPLQAVDQLVAAREVVHNIASKHGLHATLAPRLTQHGCGTGLHMNVSVDRSAGDTIHHSSRVGHHEPPAGMTLREKHFFGGILANLPSLTGVLMPTAASYGRMIDGRWSGGTYACWGIENRDVPLRLCWNQPADFDSRRYHLEIKTHDGTSNPYIATAAVIHAGLLGLETEAPLPPPAQKQAARMTPEERAGLGIVTKLPPDLPDALAILMKNQALVDRLGPEVVALHCQVRENEYKAWQGMSEAARLKLITVNY